MVVKVAKSLSGYLAAVSAIRRRWKVPRRDELWFRAEDERHRKTKLQPGLYRPRDSGKRKSVATLLELESYLYDEFQRCATQLSDTKADIGKGEWEQYFLMQHYGVPTRLLDWSDGALVALHFAVRDKPIPAQSASVVYVLDPYWLLDDLDDDRDRKDSEQRWKDFIKDKPSGDPEDWERLYLPKDPNHSSNRLVAAPAIPMLWDSPHVTRRVAAQRSRFMIFGTNPTWLAEWAQKNSSRLMSIRIPAGSIRRISEELREAGITESVIYPDLDGLGRELKQIWKSRR